MVYTAVAMKWPRWYYYIDPPPPLPQELFLETTRTLVAILYTGCYSF